MTEIIQDPSQSPDQNPVEFGGADSITPADLGAALSITQTTSFEDLMGYKPRESTLRSIREGQITYITGIGPTIRDLDQLEDGVLALISGHPIAVSRGDRVGPRFVNQPNRLSQVCLAKDSVYARI